MVKPVTMPKLFSPPLREMKSSELALEVVVMVSPDAVTRVKEVIESHAKP